jgi:hypothetical protein
MLIFSAIIAVALPSPNVGQGIPATPDILLPDVSYTFYFSFRNFLVVYGEFSPTFDF